MKIRFWGTRGSLPVSVTPPDIRKKLIAAFEGAIGRNLDSREKIEDYIDNELSFDIRGTFGGHSSCVQIGIQSQEHFICDIGSGARLLGNEMMARFGPSGQTYHIFMSHLHWDHIMGFPFFTPIYIPGNRIVIHGCHESMESAFRLQHSSPGFPVDFSVLGANIEFDLMKPGEVREFDNMRVSTKLQRHGGDSYGFRFEYDGKTVIYSTDSEHKLEDITESEEFIEFFRNADLVIFDAMYSLADAISVKADWGHSSNIVGVELCQQAGVKCFCMYHHEPAHDDQTIMQTLAETRRFEEITRSGQPLEIISAYDGLEIKL
jgi:phosphoribosyl 1,2-cyclic phosphodiesterase